MSLESVRGSGRSVVTSGSLMSTGPVAERVNLLPDAGVAVANGGEPVPADGGEEGGAVESGDAAVLAHAVEEGVLMRERRGAAAARRARR